MFFFFIDETGWGNLRLMRLHWAYLHSCVMMWMILAALWIGQFYISALKDWLQRPLWESQSLEALHPENQSHSRDVRLRLAFLLLSFVTVHIQCGREDFLIYVKSGFCHKKLNLLSFACCFFHSLLPERIVGSFVSLSEGGSEKLCSPNNCISPHLVQPHMLHKYFIRDPC